MRKQIKDFGLFVVLISLLVFSFFVFYQSWQKAHSGLVLALLDIDQGDAIFIESPSGTQVLIDGGPKNNILKVLPKVMPWWDRSIDALFITNPDADHISGFLQILRLYKVSSVFEPGTYNSSSTYKNIVTEINKQKIPNILLRRGLSIDLGGGAYLEILFPDRNVFDWSANDGSAVMRLVYGRHSFMLTGDATEKTESIILSQNKPEYLRSNFLKIGHHGSKTSTSQSFLDAVQPTHALISSGRGNSYGHPHKEVIERLNAKKVNILRADISGTIIIKCDKINPCKINKSKN